KSFTDYSCWPYYCHSQVANYYNWRTDATVSYGAWYTQGFGCYMTGGASGGPVFQYISGERYVGGVTSYVDFDQTYTAGCGRPTGVCGWHSKSMWAPDFNRRYAEMFNAVALR